MSAAAHIAHVTRGRARLRVPSVKGDARFFQRVEEELRKCPAVIDVTVNPSTASVLVRHRGDFDAVARHAETHALFDIREPPQGDGTDDGRGRLVPSVSTIDEIRDAVIAADDELRRRTNGAVDWRTLAFGALLGGSAYQLVRGKFLPAGGTMLLQALDLLFGRARGADD
jgi:hypothetical protein